MQKKIEENISTSIMQKDLPLESLGNKSIILSILITHYNRVSALMECVKALREFDFEMPYEIVVSDDGSEPQNIKIIEGLDIDILVTAPKNQGLAANINKGIKSCSGDYMLYVQEDFFMGKDFKNVFLEGCHLLKDDKLDMVRYRANYKFNHLMPCSDRIFLIPKFSFRNFNINTFRYSDHPFLTTLNFFEKFGYYLENTSVGYGETEYAIRIMNSKARIGITKINYFDAIKGIQSTVYSMPTKPKKGFKKKVWRLARAVRQHLEWILYNPKKRMLYTYKNKRN